MHFPVVIVGECFTRNSSNIGRHALFDCRGRYDVIQTAVQKDKAKLSCFA